jgi:hypothetical protein
VHAAAAAAAAAAVAHNTALRHARSFDVNKPGSEVEDHAASCAGGRYLTPPNVFLFYNTPVLCMLLLLRW